MSTALGLVGLPNAGKSTLFNALTAGHVATAAYPFTTTDPHVGVAPVQDPRLAALADVVAPERTISTSIEFVDIAGLVKGAHQGEGLGNQFLSHVFGVDALLHVVRCFSSGDVSHPMGELDPARDIEIIATELMLKDLEVLERRRQKEQKLVKSGDKHAGALVAQLERWIEALGKGTPLRQLGLAPEEAPRAFGIDVLTSKPVLYAANVSEQDLGDEAVPASVRAIAEREGATVVACCAKLEAELIELEDADRTEMMKELGLTESALPQVIRGGYAVLQLLTFFTTASRLLQAWTVPRQTKAPQAAGTIHTDFEQKFIRAEVIHVDDLIRCGNEAAARAQGLLRTEGKSYVVQDGDVMTFRVGV